jgi:hypothetical protein
MIASDTENTWRLVPVVAPGPLSECFSFLVSGSDFALEEVAFALRNHHKRVLVFIMLPISKKRRRFTRNWLAWVFEEKRSKRYPNINVGAGFQGVSIYLILLGRKAWRIWFGCVGA